MDLYPEEREAGPWRIEPLTVLRSLVLGAWQPPPPAIVAIDGRSSSGKTSLADKVRRVTEGAEVVHTDDIAWHHSVFDWANLLVEGVLMPFRRGEAVHFRPPAWEARGRPGSIEVPAETTLLVVEGVGAGRRELGGHLDAVIWVQSDRTQTQARDQQRIVAGEITAEVYSAWMAEERPFQAKHQTWAWADLIICGSAEVSREEIVVSSGVHNARDSGP
jgi:hypothetical protein